MAPRRQQAAPSRQPAGPRAQGVGLLPDDLLVKILGGLSLRARLQAAALVCRRWHACAHAPELCREVEVQPPQPWAWTPPGQLPSLHAWLRRHGQHVRRLSLILWPHGQLDAAEQQLVQCMSVAAGTMPQLQQLLVSWFGGSLDVSWAGQLPPSLRELALHSGLAGQTRISSSLSSLTQLTKLMLSADRLIVAEAVQLPPSIRTLGYEGAFATGLPPQLSTLTRLDTLVFGQGTSNFGGLVECTAQMAGLTFLELHSTYWPKCIATLTGLQHLVLEVDEAVDEPLLFEDIDAALRRLTGLTALLVRVDYPRQGSVPPALAGLSRLQQLCFLALEAPVLPPGPYSASLRVLGASMGCLNRSAALLAACCRLEHVAVLRNDQHATGAFWEWAQQHAPLRRLQMTDGSGWYELEQTARLRQARPQIEVESIDARSFMSLFKWQDPIWDKLGIFG